LNAQISLGSVITDLIAVHFNNSTVKNYDFVMKIKLTWFSWSTVCIAVYMVHMQCRIAMRLDADAVVSFE